MSLCTAQVLSVESPTRPTGSILIAGREIPIAQDHLLEPFARLLESIDRLAALPECRNGADERVRIETLYAALYGFFQQLLPSADHDALDGLAYSTALLLVGEAIQANRNVAQANVTQAAGLCLVDPKGARQ